MSNFTDAYAGLLIKQYWEQPNAFAEISAQASTWETVRDGLASFGDAFDLDLAVGAQLDIIGKIVGISRTLPFALAKIAFGFADNPNSRGFDSKFSPVANVAPFASKFDPVYTALELNDADYRLFIRVKIARNIALPYLVVDDGVGVREAVSVAFGGLAYVVDNLDMTLTLYVDPALDSARVQAVRDLDLLPKPQGVRYGLIVSAPVGGTFGFSNNVNSRGFASKFDTAYTNGGLFARKVI